MNRPTFERSQIGNVRLHVCPTDRFKTFAISANIGTPLTEATVTRAALVPFVLRRGTKRLPETKQFREKLDDLYGAGFGFDVYKRGDYQITSFRMDIIDDRYVSGHSSLLEEGLRFLGEAVSQPALKDGHFLSKYVDSEKTTLRKKLESIINEKIRYAAERCLEEMCRDEPYRLNPLGRLEQLDEIDPTSLYAHYTNWLRQSPIDLYVVGRTSLQQVEQIVRSVLQLPDDASPAEYQTVQEHRQVTDIRTVVDKLDVNQGKLNMGLRIPVTYGDDRYAAALMYNGILGGYPHSKLFTNVREKASLAYYASSRFDGHKGILTIQSGIEIANYEKAVDIIRRQLDAIRSGEISDVELNQTKAMIANHLREVQDAAFETIGFDFNNVLSGRQRTIPELIAQVEQTAISDIRQVAEAVKLDTIYFLRDRKGD